MEGVSHSDNTTPLRLLGGREQYVRSFRMAGRTGRCLRRQWQKAQRRMERAALARQEEPAPSRPRHSVRYDYW
jgi:hypothetical protein